MPKRPPHYLVVNDDGSRDEIDNGPAETPRVNDQIVIDGQPYRVTATASADYTEAPTNESETVTVWLTRVP